MDKKLWPDPPTREEALRFLKEVKETRRPEDHPWVSLMYVDPNDARLDHKIVVPVEFDGKSRKGEYIPCAICKIPKFYIGRLLWSSDKRLRLVGKDCAARHFREWSKIEDEYAREVKEIAYREYLTSAFALMTPCLNYMNDDSIKASCRRFGRNRRKLRDQLPQLYALLQASRRNFGGQLVVDRAADPRTRELMGPDATRGQSIANFEAVGVIRGPLFLDHGYSAREARSRIVENLDNLKQMKGHALSQSAIAAIVQGMRGRKLDQTVKLFRDVAEEAIELHKRLTEMRNFLSTRNFRDLMNWGKHPMNQNPFEVVIERASAIVWWDDETSAEFELRGSTLDDPAVFRRILEHNPVGL